MASQMYLSESGDRLKLYFVLSLFFSKLVLTSKYKIQRTISDSPYTDLIGSLYRPYTDIASVGQGLTYT